jgi:CHASE2 domain-containing sensor protein
MSEPGRFSLEKLVTELPSGFATLIAAVLAFLAALFLGRETLTKIPELIEASYGYDAQLRATVKNRSLATKGLPVTFVDIDDVAVRLWGDATRTTPRKKIADLIARLAENRPALIFVDFDLSGASLSDGPLQELLANYAPTSPPLLLTREIKPLDCPEGGCGGAQCAGAADAAPSGAAEDPVLPFKAVTAGKPNILWVSSVFHPDGDGIVRSWRLWEFICENGAPVLLPSPQLVAAALAGKAPAGKDRLDGYLRSLDHDGSQSANGEETWPRNRNAREALIPFLIGGASTSHVSDWLETSEFRYQRVRAMSVLSDDVAPSAIKDRVIVIGASYGPDKLKTPFGVMPGAALIANAVAVAPAVLDTAPRPWVATLLALVLASAYGYIAKTFRAVPAAVLILFLSYLWLSAATYLLNPADAVNTVGTALVILGAFLALESVIEIVIGFIEGKGFSSLLRQGHAEHSPAEKMGEP